MIQVGVQVVYQLSSTDLDRLKIYFNNLKPEYKEKSKVKFRFTQRELYPTRGFDTTPVVSLTVKYLPSGSQQNGTRNLLFNCG